MNTFEEISTLIRNSGGEFIKNMDITLETNLMEDAGLDSIQMMNLVVEIEEKFNIAFDDDDLVMDELAIVRKLVNTVDEKRNNLHESNC